MFKDTKENMNKMRIKWNMQRDPRIIGDEKYKSELEKKYAGWD